METRDEFRAQIGAVRGFTRASWRDGLHGKRGHPYIEVLQVHVDGGSSVAMLVVDDPCFIDSGGLEIIEAVARRSSAMYPEGCFVVARKAYFVPSAEGAHTPIFVFIPGAVSALHSLAPGVKPADLVQKTRTGQPFVDAHGSCVNCMVSIAVNALDEEFSVARDSIDCHQRCIILGQGPGGEWRMPYIDEFLLLEYGRRLGDSVDGEPPPPRSDANRTPDALLKAALAVEFDQKPVRRTSRQKKPAR